MDIRRVVKGGLLVVLLIAFVGLYAWAMYSYWIGSFQDNPMAEYVATALAGLIGGYVAVSFNENLPITQDSARKALNNHLMVKSKTGPDAALSAAKRTLAPGSGDPLDIIRAAYMIVYFILGFAALAMVVIAPSTDTGPVPDIIQNLALVALGLAMAIGRTAIEPASPPEQTPDQGQLHRRITDPVG